VLARGGRRRTKGSYMGKTMRLKLAGRVEGTIAQKEHEARRARCLRSTAESAFAEYALRVLDREREEEAAKRLSGWRALANPR
jgi:hypothetical protein